MTDGPFRNLKLGSRWKRFAEAVQNDAVDDAERRALASDALVREILVGDTQTLLVDLHEYVCQEQLDLDPLSSIEGIFSRYAKAPFTDTFQKELASRLSRQVASDAVIGEALEASIDAKIGEVRTRIEEECICAREFGGMWQDQFDRTVTQSSAVFDTLPKEQICAAVRANNKNAFKEAVSRKNGIDEGPSL